MALTDRFIEESGKTGNQPQFLVELPELDFYFSTHDVGIKDKVAIGEGLVIGGGWQIGAARTPYQARIAAGGIGSISSSYDTRGRSGRVSNVVISLVNTDGFGSRFTERAIDNTKCRILVGYPGFAYHDYALLFSGVVDSTTETLQLFSLTILDNSLRFRRDLNVPVGARFYPGAPVSNRGKFIPIILGRQTNIEAIQIVADASGTLAFPAPAGATEIFIREFGANFPPGFNEITVGADNSDYTGREIRVISGISYLTLTNVTGLGGGAEQPGDPVVTRNLDHVYLVGYEVAAVTEVRDDNGVINPLDYVVNLVDTGADLPTTVITFDANLLPTGKVFVDADGINVTDDPAEVLNGSFETGTTADWTMESGGTATVLTVGPLEGDFYVDVEGVNNDYRRLSQVINTLVGRFYTLRVNYRDVIPSANLLTNGDFGTGDDTGWTFVDDPVYFGARYSIEFTRNAWRAVFQKRNGGPFGAGFEAKLLKHFRYSFYQDIPTVIGQTYRLSGEGTLDSWSAGDNPFSGVLSQGGGGSASGGGVAGNSPQFWRVWFQQKIRLFAGPTGSPTDDLNVTLSGLGPEIKFGAFEQEFVASDTTTRVTIEVESQSAWDAPKMEVGPFFIYQANVERTSEARVEIGTTATPDEIIGENLLRLYSWNQKDFIFQATSGQTQISLASRWIGDTAVGTHFDAIQLLDAGRNPADAIAYIIDTFLPLVTRDEASFQTAFSKLGGWQFGSYIARPGVSEQLLEDMAFQCMSRLRRDANDVISIQVMDFSGAPEIEFDETNILEDNISIQREPIANIYTKFTIWFGRNSEEDDDHQGFQGVVYADSEATSDPIEDLRVYCAAAENIYRGVHEFVYSAEMIRDLDTAHLFLRWLVKVKTNRHLDIKFKTSHRWGLALTRGDAVLFSHEHFLDGLPYICQVLGTTITDENVEIWLRTIRVSGVFEPWEEQIFSEENVKLYEPWSS